MITDSPMNIPVIDKEIDAGELLDVVDGLAVDPVEVGFVVVDGLTVDPVEVELVAAEMVVLAAVIDVAPAA